MTWTEEQKRDVKRLWTVYYSAGLLLILVGIFVAFPGLLLCGVGLDIILVAIAFKSPEVFRVPTGTKKGKEGY